MRQRLGQRLRVLGDFLRLLAKDSRNAFQDVDEGRAPVAKVLGEVRSAPNRSRLAVEEHGQWPAALLAQGMQRAHVDGVDIGPLLPVDLDVHEQLVHDGRRRFVLEALVRHDVAPMAGGIAD